ncbi:uncharacterized protein LOC134177214 [Corticium candelabrum]|uniref:uncharacterized protein LOC134177214 n=1 Tax=Corticium candelabrum TaxID=121492 RepID=UPI002E259EBB|nr:uncharacterized protein LOC134177214 [Corticium candelabrum]
MEDSDDESEALALKELRSDESGDEKGLLALGGTFGAAQDGTFPLVVGSDRDADEESDFAGTSSRFVENEGRAKSAAQVLQKPKRTRRYRSLRRKGRWYKQPEIRRNWKVVAGAFTLLAFGIAFVIVGITVEALRVLHDKEVVDGVILFAVAAVLLIPGIYFTVVICLAAHGVRNYRFNQIPFFKS